MEKTAGTLQVVELWGSARERGRIHGEALRPLIHEGVRRWKDALGEASGMPADEYLDRFLDATNFQPAIERWASKAGVFDTPQGVYNSSLQEVWGIAEGADIRARDAYAYQLVDEQWVFTRQLREQREAVAAEHCTAFGVFDANGGPPILAQNMDLPKFYDGTQVLLHIRDEAADLESFVFTLAGLIATTGLNSRGVGVCCNTLSQLASCRDGLPVAFIVRTVLAQPSRAEAVRFVKTVRHASGQNYTIGGPDGIVSLECSANSVAEFAPLPGRVYHTNHPMVNEDREPQPNGGAAAAPDPITGRQRTNSEVRFDAAARALQNPDERITVDAVQAILSDRETLVCAMREGPTPSFTAGSLVMELSAPPTLHLAPGPPAVTEYSTWRFA